MPIVYEDDIRRDINSKHFSPIYLIFGDDLYLKNHYKDTLAKKSYDGDPFFNLQKFEGDADLQEVFDAVNQFPMMADRKCVVLSDFDFEHCSKSGFDRFIELFSNANDTCVLVVSFDNIEFDANLRGTGEIYWNEENTVKQLFYAILSTSVTFMKSNCSLQLWGQNLTNTKYTTFYFVSMKNEFVQRAKPIRLGVTVRFNF